MLRQRWKWMGKSEAFKVKVGVHHDSVFSPLLFIIVLKALSSEFREGFWNCFMWMILYWLGKQKNYYCYWRRWGNEKSGWKRRKWEWMLKRQSLYVVSGEHGSGWGFWKKNPCGVCRKGVSNNSILSIECVGWVHERYRSFSGRLNRTVDMISIAGDAWIESCKWKCTTHSLSAP